MNSDQKYQITRRARRTSSGNVRLLAATEDGLQVVDNLELDLLEGTMVYVEGISASEDIGDAVITATVAATSEEENPAGVRGWSGSATHKLTVADVSWTEDDYTERTDWVSCDLDMRPAIRVSAPIVNSTVPKGGGS